MDFQLSFQTKSQSSDRNVQNNKQKNRDYSRGVNSQFVDIVNDSLDMSWVWENYSQSMKIHTLINPSALISIILPGGHNLNDSQQAISRSWVGVEVWGGFKLITGCFFKSSFI